MQNTTKKSNGRKRHMLLLSVFMVAVVALILGAAAPGVWADDDGDELEFEEAWFNIELNASDRDVGVRGFVDGEPWKEVEIENPKGRTIAEIEAEKSMKRQGFAELFFESGEPILSDVSFRKFLRRFPEGTYEFEGETIEGDEIEGEADFTHVIPCGPDDTLDADFGTNPGSVTISWSEPTQVVDPEATDATGGTAIECTDPDEPLVIDGYEVIIEGEEIELTFKLPVVITELVLPLDLFEGGEDYEYEVIVIEESGNQTITEAEFATPE
jgi:hypothetical protein